MGVDIYGWVEVKEGNEWRALFQINLLIKRNYDMFGSLFGVENYANFKPIAEGRGLPDNADWITRETRWEYGHDVFGDTWITYKEIKEIDWEEESEDYDKRIHEYEIGEDGKLRYIMKYEWSSELSLDDYKILLEKKELKKGNKVYKLEKIKRKDVLTEDWIILFEIMDVLAKHYGDENVRLVVWFG